MSSEKYRRKSYMSPAEFKALRESTGLSYRAMSYLLDCGEQSIRNMEHAGKKPKAIGKQMALLITLIAHPTVRMLLPEIFRNKEEILRKISSAH